MLSVTDSRFWICEVNVSDNWWFKKSKSSAREKNKSSTRSHHVSIFWTWGNHIYLQNICKKSTGFWYFDLRRYFACQIEWEEVSELLVWISSSLLNSEGHKEEGEKKGMMGEDGWDEGRQIECVSLIFIYLLACLLTSSTRYRKCSNSWLHLRLLTHKVGQLLDPFCKLSLWIGFYSSYY